MESQDIMGKNVKAYREAIGLTQVEIAAMLGICRTTEQNLEKGKGIRSDTMRHIADQLKIPLAKLMSDTFRVETYLPRDSREQEGFAEQFACLPADAQKKIIISFGEILKHEQAIQNLSDEIMEILAKNASDEEDQ